VREIRAFFAEGGGRSNMSRKTYIMVDHVHGHDDLPVRICSELDENRYEVRKVEVFRDGSIGYAYDDIEAGPAGLGKLPVPPLEKIAQDPYEIFFPKEITKEEFEQIWKETVGDAR
jgi:hypothetical protein